MSNLLKNLIIALGIVLLLGGVYFFVIKKSDSEIPLDASDTPNANIELSQKTAKILADTQEVSNYTLDETIFSDLRFKALQDFSVVIDDVPAGRPNPFLQVE